MEKQYIAFISYRHNKRDKAVAMRIQALLEGYRPPKSIGQQRKRIGRVFRDESELPTSGDLSADIKEALENSEYLVVICSEQTRQSQWCMDEIRYFKQIHGGNNENILTLLIKGEPREVFPEELRYELRITESLDGQKVEERVEVEPLCADVRAATTRKSLRRLRTEFLRIAAPMLDCSYDDLYRRDRRRKYRRFAIASIAAIAALSIFSFFITFQAAEITRQKQVLEQANIEITDNLKKLQEHQLLNLVDYAQELAQAGDRTQASAILMEAYERFDPASERFDEFRLKLWPALVDAAYCPQYSPYTVTKFFDSAIEYLALNDDETIFAASSGSSIGVWNVDNGSLLYGLTADFPITYLQIRDDYLIAVQENGVLLICNLGTGKIEWNLVNPRENPKGFYLNSAVCNDDLNCLVLSITYPQQGKWTDELQFLPFPWLQAGKKTEFQFMEIPEELIMSDNGRYGAYVIEENDIIWMLDINEYLPDRQAEENLELMKIGSVNSSGNVYETQISDNGMLFIRENCDGVGYHYIFFDGISKETMLDFYDRANSYSFFPSTISEDRDYVLYEFDAELYHMNLYVNFSLQDRPLIDGYVGTPIHIKNSNLQTFPWGGNAIMDHDEFWLNIGNWPILNIDPVSTALMSMDGSFILTGTKNGKVAVISTEIPLSSYITKCPEDLKYFTPVAVSNSGSILIREGYPHYQDMLYDADTNSIRETFPYDSLRFHNNIRLSDDNTLVFYVDDYGLWQIYDTKTDIELQHQYNNNYVYYIDVSPDFQYLFELAYDNIAVYDMDTEEVLYTYPMDSAFRFGGVEDDGHTVWLMDEYGCLQTMDMRTGEVLSRLQLELDGGGTVISVSVDLDSKLASVHCRCDGLEDDSYITAVYSLEDGKFKYSLSAILDVKTFEWALSPNTQYAATPDYSYGIRLITIPTYDEALRDCWTMGAGRILTQEERRQCGLDVFCDTP